MSDTERDPDQGQAIDPPDTTGGGGKASLDSTDDENGGGAIDPPDTTGGGN
jgi:hypothetical protein